MVRVQEIDTFLGTRLLEEIKSSKAGFRACFDCSNAGGLTDEAAAADKIR